MSAATLPGHKVISRTTKVSLLSDSGSSDLGGGGGMSGPGEGGGGWGPCNPFPPPPPSVAGRGPGGGIYASKGFLSQQSMNFIP